MAFRLHFNVRLEIAGPDLDPADVRALLGLAPSQTDTEAKSRAIDDELRVLFQSGVVWQRDSFPEVLSTDLNDHLRYQLELLRRNVQHVRRLTSEGSVRLCVPATAEEPKPVLDLALLIEAEELGVQVEIEQSEDEH